MTNIELIKSDLPNTPDDVIDVWLLPHSKRQGFGWPPRIDNEWRYVLGLGRDLSYFQKMHWELREIKITPENLTPNSLSLIQSLYQVHSLKGLERVANSMAYIKEHGKFPRPIVLEETSKGYDILDGSHRITAYFYLYGWFVTEDKNVPYINVTDTQIIWVGNHVALGSLTTVA